MEVQKQEPSGLQENLPSLMEEIKSYIDQHFTERISRTELAARFYISRDHLSHIFRASFGMTIPEYVNQLRIGRAMEELEKGYAVAEAAEKAGFDNLSYFSTVFKKQIGLSPTDYQKSSRKVKDPHKK